MNAFFEHHQDNLKFRYPCFDCFLLNRSNSVLPECRSAGLLLGLSQDLSGKPGILREVARQYHDWAQRSAQQWRLEIVNDPKGWRDNFVEP